MPDEFLIFLLYLFYGMAFFAIGVSITSRDTHASNLKIASVLWLFALFAYSHAFHEWFELYESLPAPDFPEHFSPQVNLAKLGLVSVSYGFLFCFGIRLLGLSFPKKSTWFSLLPAIMVLLLLAVVFPVLGHLTAGEFAMIDTRIRNFIGFPAAVCSGLGLIFYSRTVTHISSKGAKNFIGAGIALLLYGILTGIVPSGTHLPVVNLPIELFRGLSAFIILHFVMNALHTFDEERKLLTEDRLTRFAKAEKLHALGELAFGIAHEINNPLANVSMTVEMLKNDFNGQPVSSRYKKRFEIIERNLERASKIARELLAFSSDRQPEMIPTALNEVIDSTLELLGTRRKAYQFKVTRGSIPEIEGIPWKLEEVFLNLLVNAMDATAEGEEIRITTYQQDTLVIAQIKDNGKGIPDQLLSRVMDPFFTTKEVGRGTGLGLSICHGIMELHRGTIELVSREQYGTTVTLTFPRRVCNAS